MPPQFYDGVLKQGAGEDVEEGMCPPLTDYLLLLLSFPGQFGYVMSTLSPVASHRDHRDIDLRILTLIYLWICNIENIVFPKLALLPFGGYFYPSEGKKAKGRPLLPSHVVILRSPGSCGMIESFQCELRKDPLLVLAIPTEMHSSSTGHYASLHQAVPKL
jgi:hypothetical protein